MLSEYEQRRLDNIRRNDKYLNGLGILPSRGERKTTPRVKRAIAVVEQVRRSGRLAALDIPADLYKDGSDWRKRDHTKTESVSIDAHDESVFKILREDELQNATEMKRLKAEPVLIKECSPGSSRGIDAEISVFLDQSLGLPISSAYTKASIMAMANSGRVPSFSKYLGTAEWNNSVFLWVNFKDPNCSMHNDFFDGGRRISWYGGSNVHGESDIVHKLIAYSSEGSGKSVLLFLRRPGGEYACLGRVSCASCALKTRPVQFVWSLLDFDVVSATSHFKDLLKM